MSAMSSPVTRVVELAGGQSKLARALEVKPQAVQQWVKSGRIPDGQVLRAARVISYGVTPHELASHLYPHPLDGLPEEMRTRTAA
jgi:DNA-binding transcriptional regulator YdaS (Cro superfamily)